MAARLDGLTSDERRVLDDCAVLGRRGPMMAIEVMAGKHLGIDNVRPVLESLEAKELLVLSGSDEGEKWTFRSDLVREVAYSTLTKADRARSHAGIAGWMEAHEDSERDVVVDRITFHYVRAAELINELGHVDGLPADLTEQRPAVARAGGRTGRTRPRSPSWPSASTPRGCASSPVPTARAIERSSPVGLVPWRGCARSPRRGATPSRPSRRAGRPATRVEATSDGPSSCWPTSSRRSRAGRPRTRPWTEARSVFAELGDASGEAEVLRLRGFAALFRHEYAAATGLLEQALAGFEALDDRRGVAWARQNLAWCAFYLGRAEEAEVLLRKAAATFEEIGDPAGLRWARGLLAWARFQQGYTDEAGEMADAILAGRSARRRSLGAGHDARPVGLGAALDRAHRSAPSTASARRRTLFEGIHDDFGHSQAVGRARSRARARRPHRGGHRARRLGGPARGGGPATERERTVAAMAGMSATVQVGDTERSEQLLAVAPGRRRSTWTSSSSATPSARPRSRCTACSPATSTGRWPGSPTCSNGCCPRIDPNLQSALALAHAASGAIDQALTEADEVDAHDGATYLDRITAGIARGLALARGGDGAASTAAFDQVIAAADATEDRVSQALVRLADARPRRRPGGRPTPRQRDWPRRSAVSPSLGLDRVGLAPGLRPRHGRPACRLGPSPRSGRLLDDPEVGLLGVPAVGEGDLGVLVGHRRDDDHVLACFQSAGVATLCLAVSWSESITRSSSSKLRPVEAG